MRVRVAGRASGEDGVHDRDRIRGVEIYGTEVDEDAPATARAGTYGARAIGAVPDDLRPRYFERTDHQYGFRWELRRCVVVPDADAPSFQRAEELWGSWSSEFADRPSAMSAKRVDESRAGVPLTNLDEALFDGAGATKRDLVDYLDGVRDRIVPVLEGRPLSVVRVHRGQEAFMQKNLPVYTPEWVPRAKFWAETSKREVTYALCNDRRTLLWFANQRAVEFHPALALAAQPDRVTHLVLDLDPPDAGAFAMGVRAAHLVREALAEVGLAGAVKTSGAKGVHVFVPVDDRSSPEDVAAATRAVAARAERLDPALATTAFIKDDRDGKVFVDSTRAGGATVVAAYSPRARAGVPVSFPVAWDDLDAVVPGDFTVHTALERLRDRDPWVEHMPAPQQLSAELVAEGHAIPVARVQAMHEGKRRKRNAR